MNTYNKNTKYTVTRDGNWCEERALADYTGTTRLPDADDKNATAKRNIAHSTTPSPDWQTSNNITYNGTVFQPTRNGQMPTTDLLPRKQDLQRNDVQAQARAQYEQMKTAEALALKEDVDSARFGERAPTDRNRAMKATSDRQPADITSPAITLYSASPADVVEGMTQMVRGNPFNKNTDFTKINAEYTASKER
jgi:hypothetical protein